MLLVIVSKNRAQQKKCFIAHHVVFIYCSITKIFDRFMEADRGCSDGGGADVEESAGSAGLVLITDRVMTKSCQDSKEKRRSRRSALLKERSNDEFALKCCELAYSKYHSSRHVQKRFPSITERVDWCCYIATFNAVYREAHQ